MGVRVCQWVRVGVSEEVEIPVSVRVWEQVLVSVLELEGEEVMVWVGRTVKVQLLVGVQEGDGVEVGVRDNV